MCGGGDYLSRPGVMLYFDFRPGLKRLPLEQRCVVYEAILDYAEFGEIPCFDDPASEMFWEMIRPRLDADAEAYLQKVEKRRNAANARWNASESNTMQTDANAQFALEKKKKRNTTEIEKEIVIKADKPPTLHRFSPPGVEEVRAYCQEQGYKGVDPERFVNFYESKGWMVGKSKMKSWQAAVRNWAKREKEEKGNGKCSEDYAEFVQGIGLRL